ncbi:MAG TPA: type II toxin-antitoxin system RelE/ParE family toxin [Devosia sp.]|jgi:toxin ParE1/3/4
MPLKVRRRPLAREDALEIWRYIARDNPSAADDVLSRFDELILMLARHPDAGRARPELGAGLRSFTDGRFLIVYSHDDKSLEVVRIVAGSRNLNPTFFSN